ncbi:MAG: DUF2634 domain-containing protein [Azospirillaceae bacterium]|nr:DUF2634 domain-containing protein [Azospirillaceae bacterium]
MSFTKTLTGYRRVDTRYGDSLLDVALRELGDAARWVDLANLNGLQPPYLTDDPAQASATVLLSGSQILVPSSAPAASAVADATSVFGVDVLLGRDPVAGGVLSVAAGDLGSVSGVDNLAQALRNRLDTRPGELLYHPDYGCRVHELVGQGAGAAVAQLAVAFVTEAVLADPRIASTESMVATVTGDTIAVTGTAITVDGKKLPVGVKTS